MFALSKCKVDEASLSGTAIGCTLEKEPTVGKYLPIVTTQKGNIAIAAAVAKIAVAATITAVVPDTKLNLLGNDNITFTGTNFPHDLATSTFAISFTDDQKTGCVIQSTKSTELVCLTEPFNRATATGQTYDMEVRINDEIVATTKKFTMKGEIVSSTALNPNSVSPVLKTKIVISL